MGRLRETAASLRFFGDDLDPQEITLRIGAPPTIGVRKGGVWLTSRGVEKIARTGSWRLQVDRRQPGDLDGQILELLSRLTSDLETWRELSARYRGDIFCGLFLESGNDGSTLSPATLAAIGLRGLELDLDIYAPLDD
ncbi:MAG: DUF4279 domain-containing protein [Phenylobacterium sp.]|uniref:DUF4279 domain-containing protein n=1 Tax=Phenylobacterium sp. TaxID=1871053 RepID=UPI0012077C06|nr:DUF4279 domain-containing protein [Phenylobacterium sp.]TAL32592.1 MAG: DUF4279 domain-containing protein [Phenylobacterium sp.]